MRNQFLLLLSLATPVLSFPQEAKPATATTTEVKEAPKSPFTFSGYVDSYYMGNLNSPASRSNVGASGTARAFDIRSGQFSLGLVQTKFQYSTASSDVVVDLAFGPNADLGNYGNVFGPLGRGTTALAIKQAYFNWKATDKLTFTAGQFGTHIGYEVIDAPVNYHYSLSNLFNNGPFYHIGVKAQYAISDKASVMVGLVNNVDNLNDNNRAKGLIGQIFFAPVAGWNVYLNGIVSNEANVKSNGLDSTGNYALLDLTTSYQITPKFLLGLNAAYGSQTGDYQGGGDVGKSKTWGGVALYTNYAITDNFSFGARYENFDNKSAARGLRYLDANDNLVGVSVNSFTLTGTFTAAEGHLLIKPEFRIDSFDKPFFDDDKGVISKTSQSTLGLAFIYKF
jgi:Putative beta-barrel porin-2, OmpL-like. bbp2